MNARVRSRRAAAALALAFAMAATPARAVDCASDPEASSLGFLDRACSRLVDTYKRGTDEVLVSGFSWHLPSTWSSERRAELNQNSWGAGYGRSVEKENGDTHSVFVLAFLDSHSNVEFNVGYSWMAYWGRRDSVQAGLGYTAMIIQRPDIASGIPVPIALPLASVRYQKAEVLSTFIPNVGGGINHGAVLYIFGRYRVD
jgi:palmitoyl transferase